MHAAKWRAPFKSASARGLEEDALFWATELDMAGFGEYVWKRLRIIVSEDIGWTEPQITVEIRALYENWRDQRKKDDTKHEPERLFLVDAVIRLCRCQKSRCVDHALIVFYEGPREKREIPDFALDRHTSRGRARKRGWKHFWEEGAKVCNAGPCHDPYADRAREIRRDAQTEMNL
jgi:replication-associated recombination protein RarA